MNAEKAAEILIKARQSGHRIENLPPDCRPKNCDQAYAVQAVIMRRLPNLGGWKMGRFAPSAPSVCAPLFREDIFESGAVLNARRYDPWLLEVEIGLRLLRDINATDARSPQALAQSVEFFPLIEVLTGRYIDLWKVSEPELLADSNANGAIILSEPLDDIDFSDPSPIRLEICCGDLEPRIVEQDRAETLGLFAELLQCLDARGIVMTAGQIVATGTVITPISAARQITANSAEIGRVSVTFSQ